MNYKLRIFLLVACTIILNGIFYKIYVSTRVQRTYQYEPSSRDSNLDIQEKRNKIQEMMLHAWKNYQFYAWGKNELRPVTKKVNNGIFRQSDLGLTIIDSLDTLYLMGFTKEFEEGKEWIAKNFTLENTEGDLLVFETNIRIIGGLLSLYAFTGDSIFKEKAQYVADKLLPAFRTPTGIPYEVVNLQTGKGINYSGFSILAEFGTLHLEFSYLSDITGNPIYKKVVQDIRKFLKNIEKPKGLYPKRLNPQTGKWIDFDISLGGQGDSFYEYLLKSWIQSGQTDEEAREMFDDAMKVIVDKMVRTSPDNLVYVSNLRLGSNLELEQLDNKMEHLACFAGGLFALGAKTRENDNSYMFMKVGKGLTKTCHKSYDRTPTKLGPAEFRFTKLSEATAQNSRKDYRLNPETIESYFILWRLTHNQKYRDWGWEAVEALERHCRVPHGFSGLKDVYEGEKDDVQQSFFLAETLKYLYLLFSNDSLLPLDEWVFNTEAHPLPIKGANIFYRMAT